MATIYFDLDGTLTDPKPGITRSIQYALKRLDHHTIPTEDELTWCIGPPLRASFVTLLGADHAADRAAPEPDEDVHLALPHGRPAGRGGQREHPAVEPVEVQLPDADAALDALLPDERLGLGHERRVGSVRV